MIVSLRSSNLISQKEKGQSATIIQTSGYLKLSNHKVKLSEKQYSKVVKISDFRTRIYGLETHLHGVLTV